MVKMRRTTDWIKNLIRKEGKSKSVLLNTNNDPKLQQNTKTKLSTLILCHRSFRSNTNSLKHSPHYMYNYGYSVDFYYNISTLVSALRAFSLTQVY